MELPTIPTDNLYKFMALSGLIVILFFSSFWGCERRNIPTKMPCK